MSLICPVLGVELGESTIERGGWGVGLREIGTERICHRCPFMVINFYATLPIDGA